MNLVYLHLVGGTWKLGDLDLDLRDFERTHLMCAFWRCALHRTKNILRPNMLSMSMSEKSLIPDDVTNKINNVGRKLSKIYQNMNVALPGDLNLLPGSEYNQLNKLQKKKIKLQDQIIRLQDEQINRQNEGILLKVRLCQC